MVHRLNAAGLLVAGRLAEAFSDFLTKLESECGKEGRDMALVRTKLEEASFFAKRAIAVKPEHQA